MRRTQDDLAIGCEWVPASERGVAFYQLMRSVDGGARTLVAEVRADAEHVAVDLHVRPGHRYTYVVLARTADGRLVARSAVTTVGVPERETDRPARPQHDRRVDRPQAADVATTALD